MNLKQKVLALKEELDVTIVAHFYQRDEVFDIGDITGDSLELAKKAVETDAHNMYFVGLVLWVRV